MNKTLITTAKHITTSQIEALMTEAGSAGDAEQVKICRVALGWDGDATAADVTDARAECARVIADGEMRAVAP